MENIDMKLYLYNTIALGISMTEIELSLKIILLICTIVYTIKKILEKDNGKKISEDTEVKLDLKTIGLLVGGVISLASMWFSLQGEIQDLNNKIENFGSDEFVQRIEFNLKDDLVRSTIIQIEKSTDGLKEDILDNKDRINKIEDKVYKR